jgi:hypothetical protein
MPTNKEIAEWLREAATKAALLRLYQDCTHEESKQAENMWLDRAALVEQMRCETCKYHRFKVDSRSACDCLEIFVGDGDYCSHLEGRE